MRVLLLGATGNVGSRLLPALQAHGHQVTVLVRSKSKLEKLVPSAVVSKATIVVGDASDAEAIRSALLSNRCDAMINSAGQAAIFPWQAFTMQHIEDATIKAATEASTEMGRPLRVWFLGGMSVLDYPGKPGTKLSYYLPMFTEHGHTFSKLSKLPAESVRWSMFCPSTMVPKSKEVQELSEPRGNLLVAQVDYPAQMQSFHIDWIPFLGPFTTIMGYSFRSITTLEDCADFIAEDLAKPNEDFVGHRVGVIASGKPKVV